MITQELDINVHNFETDYFYLWFFSKMSWPFLLQKNIQELLESNAVKPKPKKWNDFSHY